MNFGITARPAALKWPGELNINPNPPPPTRMICCLELTTTILFHNLRHARNNPIDGKIETP
jgi:hypothetical protein